MKIFIGTDHAGYVLKEKLVTFLKARGYEVVDKGAFKYDENDDYPDFVVPVAREISKDSDRAKGIIIGGTGEGEAI
ncbi:MAG: Ribose 5-phosphate isomerase, partial [Candidatus Nomurabacteria bacterium GW2011_GWB1_43_7]